MTQEQHVRLMQRLGKDERFLKLREEHDSLVVPYFKLRDTLTEEQFSLIVRYKMVCGEIEAVRTDLAYQMGREDGMPQGYVFF